MGQNDLTALADAVESTAQTGSAAQSAIRAAIAKYKTPPAGPVGDLGGTDEVLHLVDQILPDWTISMTGKAREPNGHWTCTLRESSWRDSNSVIGIGRAPEPHRALLAAMLRVMALQTKT